MKRPALRGYLAVSLAAIGVLPLVLFGLFFFSVLRTHIDSDMASVSESFLGAISA